MRIIYTKEILERAVVGSFSVSDVLRKLGINIAGGSHRNISKRLVEYGIDTKHFNRSNRLAVPTATTKICSKCGEEKPITNFAWANKSRSSRRAECKDCHNNPKRRRYADDSDFRVKTAENRKERLINNYTKLQEYLLTHPCVDCGETD